MPGAKIFEVEKNSFTASLISVLLVNAILGGCGPAPQGGGTPKMRLPLSIMTKTKSMDQVWGPNSTTPFHSLFGFLVPLLLRRAADPYVPICSFIPQVWGKQGLKQAFQTSLSFA